MEYPRQHTDRPFPLQVVDLKQITSAEREIARKEVEVLRSVKHPNIVHYHDSFYGMAVILFNMFSKELYITYICLGLE